MTSHDRSTRDALERDLTTLYLSATPIGFEDRIGRWHDEALRGDATQSGGAPTMLRKASWLARIAAVLTALVVAATVAAATGLIDWEEAWRFGFGTESIADDGLDVAVDQTQTVDGFTITIGRAYADPFQFAFSMRVREPDGLAGTPGGTVFYNTRVLDPDGDFLSGQPAQGVSEDGTQIGQFYANPIQPGTTAMTYRIILEDLQYQVLPIPGMAAITEIAPGLPCADVTPEPWQTPRSTPCSLLASRPVEFVVTVPLSPGLSYAPGEQISGNGAVADIEGLTSGRLGTRLSVTGVGFHADVWIDVAGVRYDLDPFLGGIACPVSADRPITYQTSDTVPLDQGPWTVHIAARPEWVPTQGATSELGDEPCYRFTPDGDWTLQIDPGTYAVGSPAG